jgi:hypothetical protein
MLDRFGCFGILLIMVALIFVVAKFFPAQNHPQTPVTLAEYQACIDAEIAQCIRMASEMT